MTSKRKVFGIGFQKTGTSSLGTIFDKLGYRVASYHDFRDFAPRDDISWDEITSRALEIANRVDAAKDTPWPLLYRELDEAFPGAKFIHLTRDTNAWIKSAVNDFADHPNAIHKAIYDVPFPKGNEEVWVKRYERHNAEVAKYFQHRPQDYLKIRLENEFSYETICTFLDEPIVGHGVPVTNTRLRKRFNTFWRRLRRKN